MFFFFKLCFQWFICYTKEIICVVYLQFYEITKSNIDARFLYVNLYKTKYELKVYRQRHFISFF